MTFPSSLTFSGNDSLSQDFSIVTPGTDVDTPWHIILSSYRERKNSTGDVVCNFDIYALSDDNDEIAASRKNIELYLRRAAWASKNSKRIRHQVFDMAPFDSDAKRFSEVTGGSITERDKYSHVQRMYHIEFTRRNWWEEEESTALVFDQKTATGFWQQISDVGIGNDYYSGARIRRVMLRPTVGSPPFAIEKMWMGIVENQDSSGDSPGLVHPIVDPQGDAGIEYLDDSVERKYTTDVTLPALDWSPDVDGYGNVINEIDFTGSLDMKRRYHIPMWAWNDTLNFYGDADTAAVAAQNMVGNWRLLMRYALDADPVTTEYEIETYTCYAESPEVQLSTPSSYWIKPSDYTDANVDEDGTSTLQVVDLGEIYIGPSTNEGYRTYNSGQFSIAINARCVGSATAKVFIDRMWLIPADRFIAVEITEGDKVTTSERHIEVVTDTDMQTSDAFLASTGASGSFGPYNVESMEQGEEPAVAYASVDYFDKQGWKMPEFANGATIVCVTDGPDSSYTTQEIDAVLVMARRTRSFF